MTHTDGVCAGATEHDDIEQAVGAQPVGAVHGCTGGLTTGQQALDDGVRVVLGRLQHLAAVVGGDSTHVVVHRRDHRDRLLQQDRAC